MADNYLEKRFDEVFGKKTVVKRVGHTLDELLLKNRSTRGYHKDFVVRRELLEQIVSVNCKTPSARNQQVLRFKIVTKDSGAEKMLPLVKMGAALPELHLPFPGTEPEAFVIVCNTVPENKMVDIDLGISVQSMLLKAAEMGLNGLIIGAFDKRKVTEAFLLPYEPLLVVAIGKSAETIRLVAVQNEESATTDEMRPPLAYYRKDGVHCVPKLSLSDLLLR